MIEVMLRECIDLPMNDESREWYLIVLRQLILSDDFQRANKHRRHEIRSVIENLITSHGIDAKIQKACQRILLDCIHMLD